MLGNLVDKMRNKKGQLGEIMTEFYTFIILFVILGIFIVGSVAISKYKGAAESPKVVVSNGAGDLLFKSVAVNWTEVEEQGINVAGKTGVEDKMIIDYVFDSNKYDDLNPIFEQLLKDAPIGTCAYLVLGGFLNGLDVFTSNGILAKKIEVKDPRDNSVVFNDGDTPNYRNSDIINKVYLTKKGLNVNFDNAVIKFYYGKCISAQQLAGGVS